MDGWNSAENAGSVDVDPNMKFSALDLSEPTTGQGHVVHFYEEDTSLIQTVTGFLGSRMAAGGSAIVISTDEHARALRLALGEVGIDVTAAEATGRYIELDADETLALLLGDDGPDAARFDGTIGGALDRVASAAQPVAAFGEMVSILWGGGRPAEAVELERLWGLLGRTRPFSLFCGYRQAMFGSDSAGIESINAHHNLLVAIPPLAVIDERSACHRFEPTLFAAPAARHFATSTLASWGLQLLRDQVELAVSELATNAILHTGGRFSVELTRHPERVQLRVADGGPSLAPGDTQMAEESATGGRGIPLVDAIVSRWGVELRENGKTIWADFDLPAPAPN
jgi:anti-sigma regulatory factor (Ser/Thr protein kinase)